VGSLKKIGLNSTTQQKSAAFLSTIGLRMGFVLHDRGVILAVNSGQTNQASVIRTLQCPVKTCL
jgi:hypothetical protein